jgi:EAL domain-containing protein (putative c-di-GMP-specific phosphodiesterase class I)
MIVETISIFANKMGVKTVGEFTSSKAIAEKLKQLGITMAQGFYYGKPEPQIVDGDQPILEEN